MVNTETKFGKEQAKKVGILDKDVAKFMGNQLPILNAAVKRDPLTATVQWEAFVRACKRRDKGCVKGVLIALKRTAGMEVK